jgi:hypothetical protein
MSVPNNTVRTREFTFAFEPKPNPKTGSEDQVMDKIPEQHKIDYIKYLESVTAMSDKALKEINSIGVQPSVPWPRTATDPTGPPNARPSPPPMPPKRIIKDEKFMERAPVDYNAVYIAVCFCAAFVLCGAVGLTLGAIFGSSL